MVNSANRRGGVKQAQLFVVVAIITACLAAALIPEVRTLVFRTYETAAFAIAPSAERAYAYGNRHFDARRPHTYDIESAEHFFTQAVQLDPTYKNVNHQLARIAFLKGQFQLALGRIDTELRVNKKPSPSSYYVRGLIEGYMGRYEAAAKDYERYLVSNPNNWAALNDYAWVLLKAGRARDAVVATAGGLKYFPDNSWLLNSNAIALYEVGLDQAALDQVKLAAKAVSEISEKEWLAAYPGNDPKIAAQGVAAFQEAVRENMHTIMLAQASGTLQSRVRP